MTLTVLSVGFPLAPVGRDAVGGSEQILSAIDAALTEAGHRSIVIGCEGSQVAGTLYAVASEDGILDDDARTRGSARQRQAIGRALQRWPIDLVHLHGLDFYNYVPSEAPTLVSLHLPLDWYPAEALRSQRDDLWLHGVSKSQHARAPEGATLLSPIANGVDIAALEVRHAKRDFALFLGRICPEKGVHLAADAAAQANCPLVIGGQVFRYEWHERYFQDEVVPRLGERCRFLGPLPLARKRRFLTAARCLVVASLVPETSSLVTMEALACGTPVVALRQGALPEIIEHGVTGFLVDDVDGMAAAIEAAGDLDPEECRRQARTRFSVRQMTDRYLTLYDSLLKTADRRVARTGS